MTNEDLYFYNPDTCNAAEQVIGCLANSGLGTQQFSLMGMGAQGEELRAEIYTAGERTKAWGGMGAFWGGIGGFMLAPIYFYIPGWNLMSMAWPVAAHLLGAIVGAFTVGCLSALCSALTMINGPMNPRLDTSTPLSERVSRASGSRVGGL